MNYVSHYDEKTSLQYGKVPANSDVMARHQLIKEIGGKCVGEAWVSGYGFTVVFGFPRSLNDNEQEILCLKLWNEELYHE